MPDEQETGRTGSLLRLAGWAAVAAINVPALVIDWQVGTACIAFVAVGAALLFGTAWLSALFGSEEVSKRAFHLVYLLFGRSFVPDDRDRSGRLLADEGPQTTLTDSLDLAVGELQIPLKEDVAAGEDGPRGR